MATFTPQQPLMVPVTTRDNVLEERFAARLLDVLIRAGLLLVVAVLVYRVFSPFLTLTVWALILAVTLYPLNRVIARRINGRQGIAATLLVLLCIALLVAPTAVLMNSLGDTIQDLITRVQTNTIEIPSPPDRVAALPFVGAKLHATWSRAHDDLPGLVLLHRGRFVSVREPDDRAQQYAGPSQQVECVGDVVGLHGQTGSSKPRRCLGKFSDLVARRIRANDRMIEQLRKSGNVLHRLILVHEGSSLERLA